MANTVQSARDFSADVQEQMSKVTWPDWPQLKNSTFVILVFVVVLALVIFGIDFVVGGALTVLTSLVGG